MPVYLHSIETAVPGNAYAQEDLRDMMLAQPARERRTPRIVRRVYDHSGIRTRHSVIAELHEDAGSSTYLDASRGQLKNPGTRARNDHYTHAARPLFERAARRALGASGFAPADVTHVITVSCTGFYAPGPDYQLVRDLNLSPDTRRAHLGFMGCCAAFPALRSARDACLADPDAVVLVASVELCSLHYQLSEDVDTLLANAVFADGGAAAVVSARTPDKKASVRPLVLTHFATTVTPVGEEDMAWTVGDHGFEMTLSSYVPNIIGEHIEGAVGRALGEQGVTPDDVTGWAVHPGGRSILDRVQSCLNLTDDQMEPSREVLAEYGNMSSATVLFVLRRLLHEPPRAAGGGLVGAMAFGPGLTVETALLSYPEGA